ncbi:MAG: 4-hydroxy-3-methylbut-2-enyl diphosphate reductase [Candidatus Riflebacteria bacterium]|nr:4-hydroxy-3-methylbut-2-enyl diphosphate reductase [Candidatus Riflebacteria bacterium]
MKIIRANTSGFCMGVKRAMQMAIETAKKTNETVYTLGPLIHNPQAIAYLKDNGVGMISDLQSVQPGNTIIIRAHGVPVENLETLKNKKAQIIDATCPHVVTSQKQIKNYSDKGYHIIIVGDPEHPEIRSLQSFAKSCSVIKDYKTALKITNLEKIMVIAQTTYNAAEFEKISKMLKEKSENAVICNSICMATSERQAEIKKLAAESDAVIIVGGKNSANTGRLAEIASEYCSNVKHIETEDELNAPDYKNCKTIVVSAGASTPDFITDKVINWLESLS